MEELICLFNKWYNKKVFEYKTWCTNKTEQKNLRDNSKTYKVSIIQEDKRSEK